MERLSGWARILSSGAPAPSATVTVYDAGTLNLSTIYSDNIATAKANPFTADVVSAYWFFYATNGRYDVKFSGGGIPSPYTVSDLLLLDSVSGGFISVLNGLNNATQTLVAGSAGTDFAIVSGGTVHTFNIPTASAANRGLVSTGAQTIAGVKTFSTPIAAGSGGSGLDGSAAGNGKLLIGNGAGFTLANLTAGANAGVTIANGAGSITLSTVQDIRTSAEPTFVRANLTGFYDGVLGTSPLLFTSWIGLGGGSIGMDNSGRAWPAIMDNGMLLIGQTASAPVAANLTPGSGILISNAPGSIIISNSGVLSLGGITGAIALAIGSGGTDINWNRGATTTLNIPDAGPLKTRGTITNGAQSIGGAKTFNNPPLAIPGSAGAGTTPGRLSQCFLRDLSAVGNVGAGEDVLSSVILPANALDTNFVSALRITGWGICAANANAKTIKLYFGATVLTTMAVAVNDGAWRVDAVVVRIGVGNQEAIGEARERAYAAGASVYSGVHILQTNPVETLSSPVTIKTTGEGVANNDIIAKCLMVEILY